MTPKEINENAKKYVLQSWSKQKNSNPMPIEKQKEFTSTITMDTVTRI